jgi:retinoid hydroxylase
MTMMKDSQVSWRYRNLMSAAVVWIAAIFLGTTHAFVTGVPKSSAAFSVFPKQTPLSVTHAPLLSVFQSLSPSSSQLKSTTTSPTSQSLINKNNDNNDNNNRNLQDLPLPPQKPPGPFRKIRDLLAYVKDPVQFIYQRSQTLGPIFRCYLFLKPTVVIGGQEAIQALVTSRENQMQIIQSALPETFTILHTKWGALNLDATQVQHKQARALFAQVLGKDALLHYTPFLDAALDTYIEDLYQRVRQRPSEPIYLVPELIDWTLQHMSILFSGQGVTPEQVQWFRDYNNGLLALSKRTPAFHKGQVALEQLRQVMHERLESPRTSNNNTMASVYLNAVHTAPGFTDVPDRRATKSVLMIWGAYVETAALMINALSLLVPDTVLYQPGRAERIRHEYAQQLQESQSTFKNTTALWNLYNSVSYTQGLVRESLRLIPQAGGGFRTSPVDFEFMGYRIPKGTVVTMDARIGNLDPTLYPEPRTVAPERWMRASTESQCPLRGTALGQGLGAWIPGGAGAHACPGIGLAELLAKMFLVKMTDRFERFECSGSGFQRRTGTIDYVQVPIKIPVDQFGLYLTPRKK